MSFKELTARAAAARKSPEETAKTPPDTETPEAAPEGTAPKKT